MLHRLLAEPSVSFISIGRGDIEEPHEETFGVDVGQGGCKWLSELIESNVANSTSLRRSSSLNRWVFIVVVGRNQVYPIQIGEW